ncbi:MAG: quinone oxidoreductase [Alphaproteobacteria bacterium]|nr:quinone oxidoreductase [Alphaproteobacteria bacterium]
MKYRAVAMQRPGGPEVLALVELERQRPAAGQVLLRQLAAGVNYIDVQHRTGRYPIARYPAVIGMEAVGMVEEVGTGVTECKPGDRVAYSTPPAGAYAEWRVMPSHRLVPVPASLDDALAGGSFLRGLTAQYLVKRTFPVASGHAIVVHAAAGGVGQILCQWAKYLGATVIGTVGSEQKVALARECGCDLVLVNGRDDVPARVREATAGAGADVVYDSIGPATFEASLASLKSRGLLVTFGTASGPLPPLDLFRLNQMGSLFVTSAGLFDYTKERKELLERASDYFDALARGIVRVAVQHRYRLGEAAQAHAELQGRRTTGPIVLIP